MAKYFNAAMHQQISERPRIKFVCERDWAHGPFGYRIGFFWDRDFDAQPGESSYKKWFTIVLKFRLWIDRSQ